MYYEINVSIKGMHLFATHKRSIQTEQKLSKVLKILEERFDPSNGFLIGVSQIHNNGRNLNGAQIQLIKDKFL